MLDPSENSVQWPSKQATGLRNSFVPVSREPHHTAIFKSLNQQDPDEQKQLLDFYSEKYRLKDLSKVQPQLYSRSQVSAIKMDELKMVSPEVIKRFDLGSYDKLL